MQGEFIPAFGRHETFHPRYAWLKKAHDIISKDPRAFRRDDATVRFGVGKNMVNAIKFWSLAFKTTKESKNGVKVTDMGKRIFDDDGIDPYLERPETLWLLHWLLLSRPCRVPVWWIILNEISSVRIKTETLQDAVMEGVDENPELGDPSEHSVKRDISVFMHMYTSRQDKLTPEEYLDCPFRNMGLARHEGKYVRFAYGSKTGLSPLVVAFACADFARKYGIVGRGITASTLAVEGGGVGNAFRLNEGDITESLETASNITGSFRLEDINGTAHMVFSKSPDASADAILQVLKREPEIVA